jgi:hypothetical protein
MKEGTKIIGSKIAGRGRETTPRLRNFQQREKREKIAQPTLHTRTILKQLNNFVVSDMLNNKKIGR